MWLITPVFTCKVTSRWLLCKKPHGYIFHKRCKYKVCWGKKSLVSNQWIPSSIWGIQGLLHASLQSTPLRRCTFDCLLNRFLLWFLFVFHRQSCDSITLSGVYFPYSKTFWPHLQYSRRSNCSDCLSNNIYFVRILKSVVYFQLRKTAIDGSLVWIFFSSNFCF